jgi:hypothetical protein
MQSAVGISAVYLRRGGGQFRVQVNAHVPLNAARSPRLHENSTVRRRRPR